MAKRFICLIIFFINSSKNECFKQSDISGVPTAKDTAYKNQAKLAISNNYYELTTIYDPIWLATLWPKLRNGAHLSLDSQCWTNLTTFFQDMLDGRAWTLNAVDATGSFSSSLLWGNRYWIGSKEQCDDLDNRYLDITRNSSTSALSHMKYVSSLNRNTENTGSRSFHETLMNREIISSMVILDNTPPYRMGFSSTSISFNITKITLRSSHTIYMGICLPLSCLPHDVHELLDFSMKTYQNLRVSGTLPREARVNRVRGLHGQYSLKDDPKFYILCSLSFIIICLIISGTVLDVNTESADSQSDIDQSSPSFKSFVKASMDPVESLASTNSSRKTAEFNNNFELGKPMTTKNRHINISEMMGRKNIEPFHTIDGLIPNRYSEIVSGLNLFSSTDNMTVCDINNRNQVNLVTVKKVIQDEDCPRVTLDIISIKNGSNSDDSSTLPSEMRNASNRKKYVISNDDSTSIFHVIDRLGISKNMDKFGCINRNNTLARVLICFSLKMNFGKIFCMDVGEDTLSAIHGIKFITILWVILVHTCLVVFQISDNKVYRGKFESNILYQTISNGTYSVDTFFVLSGLLVSYLYCQTIKKYSSDHLINVVGMFGNFIQFVAILCYRYIRLTPPYLFTIGLVEVVSSYFHASSVLELPGNDHINCNTYWWRNALYINTFYPLRETCMSWSWYLAVDSQLYAAGVVLLMLASSRPGLSASVGTALLFTAWGVTAMVAVKTGYTPSVENPLAHYDDLYDKPWTRVGPYLTGLFTGWFLSKTNCCLLLSKMTSTMLWIISLATMLCIIYGLHKTDLGLYGSAAFAALSHTAWGLAVSWILVACVSGYGGAVNNLLSYRHLYPLSRLSYCVYLLHPLLLKMVFLSNGAVLHISAEIMVIYFLGFVILSFTLALAVSLMFEAPVVSLLRLVHPMRISPD